MRQSKKKNEFYDDSIKNERNIDITDSLLWIDYSPSKMWPESTNTETDKPIIRNLDECIIMKNILAQINDKYSDQKEIAVIAPYRNQVSELRRALSSLSTKNIVTVDTVDGFQGKECDIVIFGVTRTTGSYRFLTDERRLNVALSHAKDRIIIVGHKEYTSKNKTMREISNACKTIKFQYNENLLI